MLKLEAILTGIASLIVLWFAFTRAPYSMGALVFVAMPLYLVSLGFYLRTVSSKVRAEYSEQGSGS